MVSARLSRWTFMPMGSTPMMATSAKAMTASAMAISIMVKPRAEPLSLKSEIRRPKSERNPKPEGRRPRPIGGLGLRNSEFGLLSGFGIRISEFRFEEKAGPRGKLAHGRPL